MATCLCLCHQNGMLECWNIGIRTEINYFNCKKLLQTHHSITPSFHYSNWGEAPKFLISYGLFRIGFYLKSVQFE